jgi:AraC family transcriptional regulator
VERSADLNEMQMRRACAFIDGNLAARLTLPAIARSLNMSPYHFARTFKRSVGMAPHQYVIGRRVARAKQLLSESHFPLADIALVVGCANQSHFSALFHRVTGVTPLAYRLRR